LVLLVQGAGRVVAVLLQQFMFLLVQLALVVIEIHLKMVKLTQLTDWKRFQSRLVPLVLELMILEELFIQFLGSQAEATHY
jgi:hypothetical protein